MATRLVPFSVAALEAEARSAQALCAFLGVSPPAQWPPPFNDAAVRDWFLDQLRADPEQVRWLGRYVVSTIDGADTLVGTAGYKGPPDATGTVEIGYSLVETYHRRGIGSALVRELVCAALVDEQVQRITAETPLGFAASRGLLEKCGFRQVGQKTDPGEGELAVYEYGRST